MTGAYTFPIRDTSVGLTAYRTGGNYGQAVSTTVQQSGDPANYVNLVDDGTDLANDGTTTNIQYNDQLIAANKPVDVSNQNFVHITLKQVQPQPGLSLTGTSVTLTPSSTASARLFDKNGNLLTNLTATQGDGSYLAGLFSGNVDIYVEGLQADSDFSITYSYTDANGTQTTTSIHMVMADLLLVDTNDGPAASLPGASGSNSPSDGSSPSYRVKIAGLQNEQIQQVVVASDAGDQFTDTLTNGIANGTGYAESNRSFVLADFGGAPVPSDARAFAGSNYFVNALGEADDGTFYITFTTPNGDKQQLKVDPPKPAPLFFPQNFDDDMAVLDFYSALLTLGDKGGDLGKQLAVAAVRGWKQRPQLKVNIAEDNSPAVLVQPHSSGTTLYLPTTDNYLWPEEDRQKWIDDTAQQIANIKVGYVPGIRQTQTRKGRNTVTNNTKAYWTDILTKEVNELAPIYASSYGDALVLGHELGHAEIGLSDPTPKFPGGGNVTLVENALRTASAFPMRPGIPGQRDTYSGYPVPATADVAASENRKVATFQNFKNQDGKTLLQQWSGADGVRQEILNEFSGRCFVFKIPANKNKK